MRATDRPKRPAGGYEQSARGLDSARMHMQENPKRKDYSGAQQDWHRPAANRKGEQFGAVACFAPEGADYRLPL